MSLKFDCEECGTTIISGFVNRGEKLKCRMCRKNIIVPENSEFVEEKSNLIDLSKPYLHRSQEEINIKKTSHSKEERLKKAFSYWVFPKIILNFFFLIIFISIILKIISKEFKLNSSSAQNYFLFSIIFFLIFFFTIYKYTSGKYRKGLFTEMLKIRKVPWNAYYYPLIVTLSFLGLSFLLPEIRSEREVFFDKIIFDNSGFFSGKVYFALTAVMAALCEELFFRGYLFTFFEKRHNRIVALIITGLMFGIAHISFEGVNDWWAILIITSSGFFDSFWRYRYNSVFPSMAAHLLNNSIISVIVMFS